MFKDVNVESMNNGLTLGCTRKNKKSIIFLLPFLLEKIHQNLGSDRTSHGDQWERRIALELG